MFFNLFLGDSRMDENGNPAFGPVNGSTFLHRSSPPGTNTASVTSINSGSGITASKQRLKSKKKGRDENVLYAKDLPGFLGNRVSLLF